jgi:hypothetical protein
MPENICKRGNAKLFNPKFGMNRKYFLKDKTNKLKTKLTAKLNLYRVIVGADFFAVAIIVLLLTY